jgi:hypothetical protein
MPKKFGTNSKAEEARARKSAATKEKVEQLKKAKEDASWYLFCRLNFQARNRSKDSS